eukprot:TRINITY_DN4074_c0_g1_i10.p1 TRINITY_DN4074_c0_g1~~TRINITY_DN4074_c0_g1_i10.p1  ORF type:complete len:201 (+),score=40.56 TRINITY_DN4074_c0_g1_i10:95-697(+)
MTDTKSVIEGCLKERKWKDLYDHLLEKELTEAASETKSESLFCIQLLTCLLLNNPNEARFLWKRLPAKWKKTTPELNAVWKIGRSVWSKNPKDFYSSADSYAWSKPTKPFVDALRDQRREQCKELIAKGYASISIERAAEMLGLSKDETAKELHASGWKFDDSKAFIFPAKKDKEKDKQQETASAQVQQLTGYVIQLEQV